MTIEKECEPYLQSHEVIKILQSDDPRLHAKVFNCLRKFKNYFFSTVPQHHYSIAKQTLDDFKNEAFASAEIDFYENVINNLFEPQIEYCVAYVKRIFFLAWLKLYKKELRTLNIHKEYNAATGTMQSENEGEKKLLKKNYAALQIEEVMKNLSEEDNIINDLKYVKNLKRKEIAEVLNIQPVAVNNRIFRFHNRFRLAFKNLNK